MPYITHIFLLFSLLSAVIPVRAAELQLQPVAMVEFLREGGRDEAADLLKRVAVPLHKKAAVLAGARQIPLKVWAVGSGDNIYVYLELAEPHGNVDKAALVRSAMAEAYALWRYAGQEERSAQASIYYKGGMSAESNVLLAEAVFRPVRDNVQDFVFPGPAWKRVVAVDSLGDEPTIRYIQVMQRKNTGWRLDGQEERDAPPTPEQAVFFFRRYVETGTTPIEDVNRMCSVAEAAQILAGPPERAVAYLGIFAVTSGDLSPDPQAKATLEEMRGLLSPKQDAEISRELGLAPGTVKLDKMLLTPLF